MSQAFQPGSTERNHNLPGNHHRPPAIPSSIKALAAVLLVLPILGIAAIAAIWSGGYDCIKTYKDYYALHAMAALGALDFLGSYILYQRRARLTSLIAARLLSVAWVLLLVLMLYQQIRSQH